MSVQVLLMSADENTILVVSYADLKACCERSFMELLNSGLSSSAVTCPECWRGGRAGGTDVALAVCAGNYLNTTAINRPYAQHMGGLVQPQMDWGMSLDVIAHECVCE